MRERDAEAALRAANPVDRDSAASIVPMQVGDAMLREITASGPTSPLHRVRASFESASSPGWGRVGFVSVVAVVALAVVGINVANRGSERSERSDDVAELQDPATRAVEDATVAPSPIEVEPTTTTAPRVAPVPQPTSASTESDAPVTESSVDEQPQTTVPAASSDGVFDPIQDLISLHFDHATDRDDGHATVAAKVVVDWYELTPWVVSGSYGSNKDFYRAESELVMRETWGDDVGLTWVNAHADRAGSVAATADRWQAALDAGGNIWVAEGGQSDFTAGVVRELERRLSTVNLKSRIYVVQHNSRNEGATNQTDLSYMKDTVTYVQIADGNTSNATADLDLDTPGWDQRALDSRWGSAWDAAFGYQDPDERLDFSGTVQLLHILGIPKSEVGTPAQFADRFFD